MAKMRGYREKRHQPYFDHLLRGTVANWTFPAGQAALAARMMLFTQAGNWPFSNFEGNGAWPSDQVFRILALRISLYFRVTLGPAGYAVGEGITDHLMYHKAISQIYWTLEVAQKTAFQAPTWYMPAGGGLFGDVGNDTTVYFVNGTPDHAGVCALARSVAIPARQNVRMIADIAAMGASSFLVDFAALTRGEAAIMAMLDGLHTRDVL